MQPQTHDRIAAELRSQLKALATFLPVGKLPPLESGARLPNDQRQAARTFASQLWLCEEPAEIRERVDAQPAGAEAFYRVAAFVVELFVKEKDLTLVHFTQWGRWSLLADLVSIYLKEFDNTLPGPTD